MNSNQSATIWVLVRFEGILAIESSDQAVNYAERASKTRGLTIGTEKHEASNGQPEKPAKTKEFVSSSGVAGVQVSLAQNVHPGHPGWRRN